MLRIVTVTRNGRFSLDNFREMDDLRALGEQAEREHEKEVNKLLVQQAADRFLPHFVVPSNDSSANSDAA
jgi:hypothetical protein